MLLQKQKKSSQQGKGGSNRLLVTVNVLGSAGPLRFLVNEDSVVATVVDTALKSYAREGRLPVLGSDFNSFLLYSANSGSDALSPWATVGSLGVRNFLLCKKQLEMAPQPEMTNEKSATTMVRRKGSGGSWKAWLNKSLSFKISSH